MCQTLVLVCLLAGTGGARLAPARCARLAPAARTTRLLASDRRPRLSRSIVCAIGDDDPPAPPRAGAELAPVDDAAALAAADAEPTDGIQMELVRKQLVLFWRMAQPYFRESDDAKRQLAGVLALTFLNAGLSVLFSFVGRDFWSALSAKDTTRFYELMLRYGAALVVGTPISVQYRFARSSLALSWREWMTARLTTLYLADRNYYEIEVGGAVDNPDQRLTDDVRSFTRTSLDFFITLLTSVIDLVNFSIILLGIDPNLFGAIIAYAAVGSASTVALGKPLVGLNYKQLTREADLRYLLVRLRENAESVAFFRGERQEAVGTSDRLGAVVGNARELLGVKRSLELFTTAYSYLIQVVPVLVVAPLYFSGSIELGVISQSVGAFNHILSDLSILVNEFESLSAFSAGIDRLGQLVDELGWESALEPTNRTALVDGAVDAAAPVPAAQLSAKAAQHAARISERDAADARAHASALEGGELLRVRNLAVRTPGLSGQVLCRALGFSVRETGHVLITGGSGVGKSSLLRVLSGLWSPHEGELQFRTDLADLAPRATDASAAPADGAAPVVDAAAPVVGAHNGAGAQGGVGARGGAGAQGGLLFLPQRPYCTIGSLREQLLYPRTADEAAAEWDSEALTRVLHAAKLGALIERTAALAAATGSSVEPLDVVCDWADILSLGEQQRLGFARVLTSRPALLLLDESTSALDLQTEGAMYALLEQVPGLTYVSVGHRPSLRKYHREALHLEAGGAQMQSIARGDEGVEAGEDGR